jgi:hypothetical protein
MTGLIPFRDAHGKPYNGAASRYFVSASDATAIYIGDPVTISGTNTETAGKYRTVARATLAAGNLWCGVMVGVEPISPETVTTAPDLSRKHRPASTAMYVWVADDPGLEFLAGEDEGGAALVTGDIGNLGIMITGSGSTSYGTSGLLLDSSSFTSGTATGQILLCGLVDRADFALGGDGQLFRVKINEAMHQLATPGTTV